MVAYACLKPDPVVIKMSEYDQEIAQRSQTNHRHCAEETATYQQAALPSFNIIIVKLKSTLKSSLVSCLIDPVFKLEGQVALKGSP